MVNNENKEVSSPSFHYFTIPVIYSTVNTLTDYNLSLLPCAPFHRCLSPRISIYLRYFNKIQCSWFCMINEQVQQHLLLLKEHRNKRKILKDGKKLHDVVMNLHRSNSFVKSDGIYLLLLWTANGKLSYLHNMCHYGST